MGSNPIVSAIKPKSYPHPSPPKTSLSNFCLSFGGLCCGLSQLVVLLLLVHHCGLRRIMLCAGEVTCSQVSRFCF